jgi:hypothetical protein
MPDRVNGASGRLKAWGAVGALALVTACALVFTATRLARVAHAGTPPTVASNRLLAQSVARKLLDEAVLPAGARQVSADPGLGPWLSGPPGTPATALVTDVHRFWRVPGDPQTVIDWITSHRPAGLSPGGTSTGGLHGKTVYWGVTFNRPAIAGRVSQPQLSFGVTAAAGGGAAVRADAIAVSIIPRPAGDSVPAGVRSVGVFVDRYGGRAFPAASVSARRTVARLVAWADSRQLRQPGDATACPEIGPSTRVVDLRFRAARGGRATPLARVVEDACGGLEFFIHGRRETGLEEGTTLRDMLWRLHALPVCGPQQLAASATRVTRTPAPVQEEVELRFRNASSRVCALKGFGRLALRGSAGRQSGSHIVDARFPGEVVLLTPGDSAAIDLSWSAAGPSCPGTSVPTVDVILPGLKGHFEVPVGSSTQPVAPCGAITAGAVEGG